MWKKSILFVLILIGMINMTNGVLVYDYSYSFAGFPLREATATSYVSGNFSVNASIFLTNVSIKAYKVNEPIGNIWVSIQQCTDHHANFTVLTNSSTNVDGSTLKTNTSGEYYDFIFSDFYVLNSDTEYCILYSSDAIINASNYYRVYYGTTNAINIIWSNTPWDDDPPKSLTFRISGETGITNISEINLTRNGYYQRLYYPYATGNSSTNTPNFIVSTFALHDCYTSTDNATWNACSTTNTTSHNCTQAASLSDGHNFEYFKCNATTTNAESYLNVTVFVDTIFPSINTVYPVLNGSGFDSMVDVNYTILDATNATNCWWTNHTGSNITLAGCSNITGQTWNEGYNNITIYVNDSVGNTNSSHRYFYIDTINPIVVFSNSTIADVTVNIQTKMYVNVTDQYNNISSVTAEVKDPDNIKINYTMLLYAGNNSLTNVTTQWNYNHTPTKVGTWYVKYYGVDSVDNDDNTTEEYDSFAVSQVSAGDSGVGGGGGSGSTIYVGLPKSNLTRIEPSNITLLMTPGETNIGEFRIYNLADKDIVVDVLFNSVLSSEESKGWLVFKSGEQSLIGFEGLTLQKPTGITAEYTYIRYNMQVPSTTEYGKYYVYYDVVDEEGKARTLTFNIEVVENKFLAILNIDNLSDTGKSMLSIVMTIALTILLTSIVVLI